MCDQCDARTEYAPARMAARARAAAQQLGAEIKTSAAVDAAGQQPAIGLRHRLPGIELTLDEGMLAKGVPQQIGRESWRERVGKDVKILVVGVTLKKKQQHKRECT